ncbi:MAG: sulfide-dependent adenosine diphosphate thiazole synthase [Myxococcota bacterium]
MREERTIFGSGGEKEITKAITTEWSRMFSDCIESDVVIAGAGPSGLVCAMELAKKGKKVVVVEGNNYLGGGFWIGGYLMNKLTVRAPAQEILDELKIPYKEWTGSLFVADAPTACSKLIAASCDAGVRFLNMTSVTDVVLRENNRVSGVVINWTPVQTLPRQITCVDPVALETKLVVDATGHDAHVVKSLSERGIVKLPGNGAMWVERSEDAVVEKTGEIHPGLLVIGMAVSASYGLPRMGPTFGSMLISGRKGAEKALSLLNG